jgi:hypothetical protein
MRRKIICSYLFGATLTLLTPALAVAAGVCRIGAVTLEPGIIEKTLLPDTTACMQNFPVACDDAVTALDEKCIAACAPYKKRGVPPTTKSTTDCMANPVVATIPEYNAKFCIAETPGSEKTKYTVSCTVSAQCTCDP